MTHDSTHGTAGGVSGRSLVKALLPAPRNGVRSGSPAASYTRRVQDLIGRQNQVERAAEVWARTLGERAEGRTDLLTVETLRTLALFCIAGLGERGEPVETEELARLALALCRIESADRLRVERELTLAKAAARGGGAAKKAGLSPESVAAIRRAVEGDVHR